MIELPGASRLRKLALFENAGYSTIDLGDLTTGGKMQQVQGPLAGVNLIRIADPTGH